MSGYVTRREGESGADFNRRQFWREVDEEKAEREPNAAVTRATWLPSASMAQLDRAFADGVEIEMGRSLWLYPVPVRLDDDGEPIDESEEIAPAVQS